MMDMDRPPCSQIVSVPFLKWILFSLNCVGDLKCRRSWAASSIVFHKLSKQKVRQIRPWAPSSSAKPTGRGSCGEIQSIHMPKLVTVRNLETIDFLFLFSFFDIHRVPKQIFGCEDRRIFI